MAEECRCDTGGIIRLQALTREHGEELEADLIAAGLRLRDCPSEEFDWRDLRIFVKYVGVDSHLYRTLFPEAADWDLQNQLLATILDTMRWFQWVKLGHEGAPPNPIPRPGVKPPEGSHRRGNAPRSETNRVLGMRLTKEEDPDREAKLRRIFRGPYTGPIRDLSKAQEVK